MQYLSPIRLFKYSNIEFSSLNISQIKKILTAEFSVMESGIISVNGFDYSKNDIFEELEKDNFTQRLKYHQVIWEKKNLLNCLEKNKIILIETNDWFSSLKNNESFKLFISPYFSVSFDKIMREYLKNNNFKSASEWINYLLFVKGAEDEEIALKGIRIYFRDISYTLRNVNNITYKSILPKINQWSESFSYKFINSLPPNLYPNVDPLIKTFIDLSCLLQTTNKKLAYKISVWLMKIDFIDPDLKKLIQENHSIFQHNNKNYLIRNKTRVLLIVIKIFILIYFTKTCN